MFFIYKDLIYIFLFKYFLEIFYYSNGIIIINGQELNVFSTCSKAFIIIVTV